MATPVGAALGYIVGGYLQDRFDWRRAFYIAGGPGLLLALVVLLIREPARAAAGSGAAPSGGPASTRSSARSRSSTAFTVAGYVAQTFALGGFTAWAAPFLSRKLCLDLGTAGTRSSATSRR